MNKNQNDGSNSLLYSLLLSMESADNYEVTLEDKRYSLNQKVSECQVKMYQLVIVCLSKGMTYQEISDYISKIDIEEYKRLTEEEQNYLQRKLRKDLNSRERKMKERLNNE